VSPKSFIGPVSGGSFVAAGTYLAAVPWWAVVLAVVLHGLFWRPAKLVCEYGAFRRIGYGEVEARDRATRAVHRAQVWEDPALDGRRRDRRSVPEQSPDPDPPPD